MSLPQLRVFTFAVIRGLMPLGVAQTKVTITNCGFIIVIRGLMPLGVAQEWYAQWYGDYSSVIRGLMPLGVAQRTLQNSTLSSLRDSWLDAVRRCSKGRN